MQRTRRYEDFLYSEFKSALPQPVGRADSGDGLPAGWNSMRSPRSLKPTTTSSRSGVRVTPSSRARAIRSLTACTGVQAGPSNSRRRLPWWSPGSVDYDYVSNPPKYDTNLRQYVIEFGGGDTSGEFTADDGECCTISKVVTYRNELKNTVRCHSDTMRPGSYCRTSRRAETQGCAGRGDMALQVDQKFKQYAGRTSAGHAGSGPEGMVWRAGGLVAPVRHFTPASSSALRPRLPVPAPMACIKSSAR